MSSFIEYIEAALFKVGDLVQKNDFPIGNSKSIIVDEGVIVEVIPPTLKITLYSDEWRKLSKKEKAKTEYIYKVKWNSSKRIKRETNFSIFLISLRDSEIEREFRNAVNNTMEKIHILLDEAKHSLEKAQDIADKNGIPFSASVSPLYQTYCPQTFNNKFSNISEDKMGEIVGFVPKCQDGWEHSQIC